MLRSQVFEVPGIASLFHGYFGAAYSATGRDSSIFIPTKLHYNRVRGNRWRYSYVMVRRICLSKVSVFKG